MMDQSFAKTNRLRNSQDFRRVIGSGRRSGNGFFTLYTIAPVDGISRLGITTSRKVGSAVIRNRIKRVIREFYRMNQLRLTRPLECAVIARPAAGRADNVSLRQQLEQVFGRVSAFSPGALSNVQEN